MDDVIVIGAGWSGLAAAIFAHEQGLKVRLIAQGIGTIIVTPGWISVWESVATELLPAVQRLTTTVPTHPYSLAGVEALQAGIEMFRRFTEKIDLPYVGDLSHNLSQPTALGTRQYPALVASGYHAEVGANPLYVGFDGWRDFYPALSGGRGLSVPLPQSARPWDFTPTDLARSFDDAAYRQLVARAIRPRLDGATSVGFPAVLGLEEPRLAVRDLSAQLGVPVFEMPTLPPSVPGTRLFNKARRYFLDQRVRMVVGHPVVRGIVEDGRAVGVEVGAAGKPQSFRAKSIILATGGLYGGGLFSDDRGKIWEPLFDLDVSYEPDQTKWFSRTLLDATGHAVHHFGLRVNAAMQPLNLAGEVAVQGLYCVGHVIAQPTHPDAPIPTECSEGVALATAYKAVQMIKQAQHT